MIFLNVSCIFGVSEKSRPYIRGEEMNKIGFIKNGWIRVRDGKIHSYGSMTEVPELLSGEEKLDCKGCIAVPSFCDSHTHLVYPEERCGEFIDKINGLSYEEIAARGGGILNSADKMAYISEEALYATSLDRLHEIMQKGTGAVEIKSGYGLTLETELKMLRVIARLAESVPITVRATFLGAHAVGRIFAGRQEDYVRHIIDDMLPAVSTQGIARYVDVFCDKGFFTTDQTDQILTAAARYGLRPKIHGNELDESGGVEVAVDNKALSVDHLERAGNRQFELLGKSQTVATMLPGASFFLGMPYGDARSAIRHNAIVSLASDFNPGSSPSGDMRFVWALGCIKMKLTPVQALNAMTVNGAYAMGLENTHGTIAAGRSANFIVSRPLWKDSILSAEQMLAEIPYRYTRPWIQHLVYDGKLFKN